MLLLAACAGNDQKDRGSAGGGQAGAVKDYPVLTLVPRTTTLNSEFPATIEGQQDIEIRPKIDGYIEEIFVDEGASVKKTRSFFE